ncbi:MAG TPA: hypothetical protein VK157_13010 [Phycisphaerales bacterium]|nr:hypothetical protein [Phycisphaerales bacterium]
MTKKRVIVCCIVAAVLVAFVAREIYLARFAPADIRTDYSELINDRVQAACAPLGTPSGDYQTFVTLLAAIESADKAVVASLRADAPTKEVSYTALTDPAATPEAVALAQRALQAHRETGRLDALAALPQLVGVARMLPSNQTLFLTVVPELQDARHVARLLAAQLSFAIRANDPDAAARALEQITALHVILTHQCTMIDRLTADAILLVAFERIRDEHAAGRITGALAARLLAILQRADQRPPTALQLTTERDGLLDIIQRTHTASGRFIAREYREVLQVDSANGIAVPKMPSLLMPSRDETEKELKEYYDLALATAQQPSRARNTSQLTTLVFSIQQRNELLAVLLPAIDAFLVKDDHFLTQLHGVQILLALEVHRSRTGSYPQTLAELVPSELTAVPTDPFAKDNAFVYRRRPADATSGRPFLLYSVAQDGADNTGTSAADEQLAWARNQAGIGYDFVINRPSPSAEKPINEPTNEPSK